MHKGILLSADRHLLSAKKFKRKKWGMSGAKRLAVSGKPKVVFDLGSKT
jgi:hypothetical protein